jgi:hypothetical protein
MTTLFYYEIEIMFIILFTIKVSLKEELYQGWRRKRGNNENELSKVHCGRGGMANEEIAC